MREPPKMYRPYPGEEWSAALHGVSDSIEAAMAWIHEAVERVEQSTEEKGGD